MKTQRPKSTSPATILRKLAMQYPGAEEGVACAGTALEKRTIKAGGKAFVFLGTSDAMVKLRDSLPEAAKMAAAVPGSCKVGAGGWVKVTWSSDIPAPMQAFTRWIDESYRLLAPRSLVESLTAGTGAGKQKPVARQGAKKTRAR